MVEENSFEIDLLGALDQKKTKKQINSDLKQIETVINALRITGMFAQGDTKKNLNSYIKSLQSQLDYVKLTAKIDSKNLKNDVDKALNSVSFKDIDALNIDENKAKLKVQKVIADAKAYVAKNPVSIGINYENRRSKLDNDLTAYLNKNTKIQESSIFLKEADKIRTLIGAINDKKSLREATDAFQLYKSSVASVGYNTKSTSDKIKDMLSHVTRIGSAFGVASMLTNNFAKSLKTLRSNDTILTEISKTSEMTKKQLQELGDEAFKIAGKYGQLSSNYLLAVQEMARSGYENASKELGELSLLAQSAGDMTADNANNYLLATDAAYKYSGSVEKLNAALDGANYISNRNSASLTDIADATRVSASFAANAGVAIDELTAAESTMIAVTKRSGSEIGRAFRSIILNLQQVSGEFDGEVIDEEQLKKVEARCHSLGVELEYMKDGIATLRNPMEILKELAEVYNSLPDSSAEKQGLISDLGGKYHANALSGLLSRWDMYEKMLNEFSQGTGSALEEAEKTAKSWEGRLNSLSNSFTSFVNTLTNKDTILSGISIIDRLIQGGESLIDIFGEIPIILTAVNSSLIAMNKNYGITKIWDKENHKFDIEGNALGIDFTAIKNQKKHFEEAGKAISGWNSKLLQGQTDIDDFEDSVAQSSASLKEYLSTCSKDAPASLQGYRQYLKSTGQASDELRLKTILLNSVMTFLGGIALQAVITGITTAIDNYIHRVEKAREKLEESNSTFKSTTSELEQLQKELDETAAKMAELESDGITLVNSDEYDKLVDTNEELERTIALKKIEQKLNADQAVSDAMNLYGTLTEHSAPSEDRVEALVKSRKTDSLLDVYDLASHMDAGKNDINELLATYQILNDALDETKAKMNDLKDRDDDESGYELENLQNHVEALEGYLGDASGYINAYMQDAQQIYDTTKDAMDLGVELTDYQKSAFNNTSNALDMILDNLLSVPQKLDKLVEKNEWQDSLTELFNKEESLDEITKALIIRYPELMRFLSDNGITVDELAEKYRDLGDAQGAIGENSDFTPTISSSVQQLARQLEPQFAELAEAYQSIFKFDDKGNRTFSLDDVGNPMLESLRKSFAEIEKEIGVTFDASALNPFFDTLIDGNSTAEEVQQAFNELATVYFYSTDTLAQLNEETADAIEKQLEEMGVTNASEIVTTALAEKELELAAAKEYLAQTSEELADATGSEIAQFGAEQVASGECSEALALFYLKKVLLNTTFISTSADVSNILTLAEAAGVTTESLVKLANVKAQFDAAVASGNAFKVGGAYAAMQIALNEVRNDITNFKPVEVDFDKIAPASKAKSSGKKAADEYLEAFEKELEKLKDLKDRGKITEKEYLDQLRVKKNALYRSNTI